MNQPPGVRNVSGPGMSLRPISPLNGSASDSLPIVCTSLFVEIVPLHKDTAAMRFCHAWPLEHPSVFIRAGCIERFRIERTSKPFLYRIARTRRRLPASRAGNGPTVCTDHSAGWQKMIKILCPTDDIHSIIDLGTVPESFPNFRVLLIVHVPVSRCLGWIEHVRKWKRRDMSIAENHIEIEAMQYGFDRRCQCRSKRKSRPKTTRHVRSAQAMPHDNVVTRQGSRTCRHPIRI